MENGKLGIGPLKAGSAAGPFACERAHLFELALGKALLVLADLRHEEIGDRDFKGHRVETTTLTLDGHKVIDQPAAQETVISNLQWLADRNKYTGARQIGYNAAVIALCRNKGARKAKRQPWSSTLGRVEICLEVVFSLTRHLTHLTQCILTISGLIGLNLPNHRHIDRRGCGWSSASRH